MTDRHCQLPYGCSHLEVDLPEENLLGVLTPRAVQLPPNAPDAIRQALAAPIASPPLRDILRPGERVTIIASDITRVTRSEVVLPVLVDEIAACGVRDQDITILFAMGFHRAHTPEEQRRLVGDALADRLRLVDHDAFDAAQNVLIGTTSRGTPVEVNRIATEADHVILTGAITYHYFAGFTGGRKALIPGVTSFATLSRNHCLVLNPEPGAGIHPDAANGRLDGNPVHEDMIEAAAMVGPTFLVNVVCDPAHEIAGVFAGDWVEAHRRGAAFLDEYHRVEIAAPADLAIVGCGGMPRDINMIQSHKAIANSFPAVRPGGVMILLAQCPDGIGSSDFYDWCRLGSLATIEERLRQEYRVHGQTAHATLRKAQQIRIIMVSDLDPAVIEHMGMTPAPDLPAALALAREWLGPDATTYVIPDGHNLRIVRAA
jgi:nickel-dependent lactate racemase